MKSNRELRIGIFAVAVVLLSFCVINFLRGKDLLNREMEISASYPDVCGLVPSDPVYIRGYKAGSVVSVDYDRDADTFHVVCSVLRKFRIPEDSEMTIYGRDIMGGKAVRIDPGFSSEMASDGAELTAGIQPDLFSSLSGELSPIARKLSETLENMDSVAVSLNAMFGKETAASVANTLGSLESAMAHAEKISAAVSGRSAELVLLIDNMTAVSEKLRSVSEKADTVMSDVSEVSASLAEADVKGLVDSFGNLLDSIQDPDGTIGKLLSDGSVYDSLDEFVRDADMLLKKIQENPKKYIRISLF